MVEILNGAAKDLPLAGWVIGTWHGSWVIGRPHNARRRVQAPPPQGGEAWVPIDRPEASDIVALEPAYEITLATQVGPQGIGVARMAFPLKSFPSIRRIDGVAVAIRVDDLARNERVHLQKAVIACDEILMKMRAEDAGIATPRPDAARKLKLG